jgi:hypothetical protein
MLCKPVLALTSCCLIGVRRAIRKNDAPHLIFQLATPYNDFQIRDG